MRDHTMVDPLDAIETRRFDTEEIVDRLNEYDDLTDAEQEAQLNQWEYSGLADAQHPLTSLLPELHNVAIVVRDLDGALRLIVDDPRDGLWRIRPLYDADMPHGEMFEEAVASAEGLEIDQDLLKAAIATLPPAQSPSARIDTT